MLAFGTLYIGFMTLTMQPDETLNSEISDKVVRYKSSNKCCISVVLLAIMSVEDFCLCYCKLVQSDNFFLNLCECSDFYLINKTKV